MSVKQRTSPTVSQFTMGIYSPSLKSELHQKLPLFGAQPLTSLGNACRIPIVSVQA
ncbi:MAG: hypothetical protein QOC76_4297 [Mycobacterium sp.]|jgi:hypothetical protein|nr:hypothetical protein [Mycobacterium sp.]